MDTAATYTSAPKRPLSFLGRICIVGLGVSGSAVAAFCHKHLGGLVSSFVIYAGKKCETTALAAQAYIDAGIEVYFDTETVEGSYDIAVISPGIPQSSAFYKSAEAAARLALSEPELAFLVSDTHWIAITGTNGKTTTTALCAHLLRAGGLDAKAVGNIGDTCIAAVDDCDAESYLVAELSSYQLASIHSLRADAAVLLNITPDHLAWHGTHEAYVEAKMKLFANLAGTAPAIVDINDAGAAACAAQMRAADTRVIGIDTAAQCSQADTASCIDGMLGVELAEGGYQELCPASDLAIKGDHNVVNALAAASVALVCGVSAQTLAAALCSFQALEHRIEACGRVDSIAFFNDSKATNTDAVIKALTAFDDSTPLIVLLGGLDKGTDLSQLVESCERSCKAVVCYGQAKQRFYEAFAHVSIDVYCAQGLIEASDLAFSHAQAGDVVLLSPACASFDEFNSFEQRGEVFKDHIAHMKGFER